MFLTVWDLQPLLQWAHIFSSYPTNSFHWQNRFFRFLSEKASWSSVLLFTESQHTSICFWQKGLMAVILSVFLSVAIWWGGGVYSMLGNYTTSQHTTDSNTSNNSNLKSQNEDCLTVERINESIKILFFFWLQNILPCIGSHYITYPCTYSFHCACAVTDLKTLKTRKDGLQWSIY